MKSIALSAAVLCAMSSFSFGQQAQPATPDEAQRTGASRQESRNDPAMAQMGGMDKRQRCIREDMTGNQFEIQMSQVVQQRAQNPQIKQLAERIAQDHQKAQQQLQQAIQGEGQGAAASGSAELMPHQQAMLTEMQNKPVDELERGYVFHMVGDHEKDILMYRYQAEHGPDQNLQRYAREQLPVLEEHLRLTRAAAAQYVGEARQAGEHMKGTNSMNNAASAGHDSVNPANQPNKEGAGAPGGTGTDRTIHR